MKESIKRILRHWLIRLRIPVTRNIRYDIYTEQALKIILKGESNCIDVGAHKGEILDNFLTLAPKGWHFAFEPIPQLYQQLVSKYGNKVTIYPYALSAEEGKTQFNVVVDDPAYSGLQQREYRKRDVRIEKIEVEKRRLDDVILQRNHKIDLIKIDVEGGEFDVLKGAKGILKSDKPALIFECGKGASEFYGTQPSDIFSYLTSFGYEIRSLGAFVRHQPALKESEFVQVFAEGSDYYFVAQ